MKANGSRVMSVINPANNYYAHEHAIHIILFGIMVHGTLFSLAFTALYKVYIYCNHLVHEWKK